MVQVQQVVDTAGGGGAGPDVVQQQQVLILSCLTFYQLDTTVLQAGGRGNRNGIPHQVLM